MKYNDIISFENLFKAWCEFVNGKRHKRDVAEFSLNLSSNISLLNSELKHKTYNHSNYVAFDITDPKPRNIHKASVRDRLLHHAICSIIYPYFDKKFIFDCYSSREYKGTHKAMNRLNLFFRNVSKNNTRTCWVLKCDIQKFFASIDQQTLFNIVNKHISDPDIVWLINNVVSSFETKPGKGLPLGNLTSQLLVNVYMNEFDQFIKHVLKIKYYVRYADDFVILSENREYLEKILSEIRKFLGDVLKLNLHPNKVSIKTFSSGIDFLGWVHFPNHSVLRTTTKRRAIQRIKQFGDNNDIVQSYFGLLQYGNAYKITKKIKDIIDNPKD